MPVLHTLPFMKPRLYIPLTSFQAMGISSGAPDLHSLCFTVDAGGEPFTPEVEG